MIGSTKMAFVNDRSKVLTRREHEVALLVSRGLSNKAVARALGLSAGPSNYIYTELSRSLALKAVTRSEREHSFSPPPNKPRNLSLQDMMAGRFRGNSGA